MNHLASVIFINIACNIPFATFMFRSFVATIPEELEEAAKIDGAGTFRIFWKITFPLLKPIVATKKMFYYRKSTEISDSFQQTGQVYSRCLFLGHYHC